MKQPVLIAALVVAGGASAQQATRTPELISGGRCLRTQLIRQTFVRDAATIDFDMKTGRVVRNRLPEACPGLGPTRAISYRAYRDRLCVGDLITVLPAAGPVLGPTCKLGAFESLGPRTRR